MKLVYICHPLSGDIEVNLASAALWYRWAAEQRGIVPTAPYFAALAAYSDTNEAEREAGFQIGLCILQSCQELWVCGGRISRGMQREIDAALGWNTPVIYHEEMT